MSSDYKGQASLTDVETSSHDVEVQLHRSVKTYHSVDNARMALSGLALLCGLAALGTSAHSLAVYESTHVAEAFNLPLWPDEFDLRPTVALVAGSSIVLIASVVSITFSKVQKLRSLPALHTMITVAAPLIGFVGAMISVIFFYAVNSSTTVDTLQSWSCEWQHAIMLTDPDFGSLCHESETALYLAVILIPLELFVLTAAGYQMVLGKKANQFAQPHGRISPLMP